jgi:hypothetical protein
MDQLLTFFENSYSVFSGNREKNNTCFFQAVKHLPLNSSFFSGNKYFSLQGHTEQTSPSRKR